MADKRKSPGKIEAKANRDKRLADALRANLRRRKAAETAETRSGARSSQDRSKGPKGEGNGG
jgi:hypothetical protein